MRLKKSYHVDAHLNCVTCIECNAHMATAHTKSAAAAYYEQIGKQELLTNPHKYSWNTILYYIQFTQDELLSVKTYLPLPELILYQHAITRMYLRMHFTTEIDNCLEISWSSIERHVTG